MTKKSAKNGAIKGKLKVFDPFELIRWLAHSQPDPRKAVAELVQNSLDAQASEIRLIRQRQRSRGSLQIIDNGEGIIPELGRAEALEYIATHIGHSRKRQLSPQQRLNLMTQGQYGIGLLGFWCLGQALEIRSFLPGQAPYRLVLYRDNPEYKIEPITGKLALDERLTEVIVSGVHPEAAPILTGTRIADFLAYELRGQLLARKVKVFFEDRLLRGKSRQQLQIKPPQFLGERIENLTPVHVPGYPAIKCEIYFCGQATDAAPQPPLAIYSGGTAIADSFHNLGFLGLNREPWTNPGLTGFIDFPALNTSPGSRRGVQPDEAAGVFAMALESIEPALQAFMRGVEHRRSESIDRTLIRDLQSAFRELFASRPKYSLLPVLRRGVDNNQIPASDLPAATHAGGLVAAEPPPSANLLDESTLDATSEPSGDSGDDTWLFPPGPLAKVVVRPKKLVLAPGQARDLTAVAVDRDGREITSPYAISWTPVGAPGIIQPLADQPHAATFVADDKPGRGVLVVNVVSQGLQADAKVSVVVGYASGGDEGIPEPDLIDQPGETWRSRLVAERWQVNTAHAEYRSVADRPALKLRYLMLLFAKEVVLRSSQDPRLAEPLEQLIEVASFADRELANKRRGKKPKGEE